MTLSDAEIAAMTENERRELIQRLMQPTDKLINVQRMTWVLRLRLTMMIGGCIVMLPWMVYLRLTLPGQYTAPDWQLTWLGFDCILVMLMALTAILGLLHRMAVMLTSFATGVLMLCDAWFDITTSNGHNRPSALLLATLIEIPVAAILISITFMKMHVIAARQWLTKSHIRVWRLRIHH
ncbi:hypothetical protein [Flexivirga caeni]|uniref:Uncharacterized protein n=1 Tax=Flexivirga caeni TaxID=2294115 RepID=A0A3M9ME92_9MICO|nr:hypothetical protein [Flexivirga caeni]RNI23892.1 hypothetical protein EFY87_06385 [Flexivirga caeni]